MPSAYDLQEFHRAIKKNDRAEISNFLKRDDAKELLLTWHSECLPIHVACERNLDEASLRLILDAAVEHEIIKEMLEANNRDRHTCFHLACEYKLSVDSFRLLLEYSSKYADIKKKLEAKTSAALRGGDYTCLHYACSKNVLTSAMSTDSLRLLLDYLSKYADIKGVLEEKDEIGNTCLYSGSSTLATDSLRLLLDYFSKYADIKKILEDKNVYKRTCLSLVCDCYLSTESHRLLFEYLVKYADVKNMVEAKDRDEKTCLHFACDNSQFPTDSLRLLISFFPSNESLQRVLNSKAHVAGSKTPLDYASKDEHKQLLQDPDCWQKCRYWLLCNHQETFLNRLYPNSPEQTLEALKELSKSYADDETLKKAIAELDLSALRKENEELKKKVEVLEQENKQVKEERTALMKQLYAGFG